MLWLIGYAALVVWALRRWDRAHGRRSGCAGDLVGVIGAVLVLYGIASAPWLALPTLALVAVLVALGAYGRRRQLPRPADRAAAAPRRPLCPQRPTAWGSEVSDLMDGGTIEAMEPRQCTGTSKQSGERCRRRPAKGQAVCVIHGGGSPQAQRAARARQLGAQARAAAVRGRPTRPNHERPLDALEALAAEALEAKDLLAAKMVEGHDDEALAQAFGEMTREADRLVSQLARLRGGFGRWPAKVPTRRLR